MRANVGRRGTFNVLTLNDQHIEVHRRAILFFMFALSFEWLVGGVAAPFTLPPLPFVYGPPRQSGVYVPFRVYIRGYIYICVWRNMALRINIRRVDESRDASGDGASFSVSPSVS